MLVQDSQAAPITASAARPDELRRHRARRDQETPRDRWGADGKRDPHRPVAPGRGEHPPARRRIARDIRQVLGHGAGHRDPPGHGRREDGQPDARRRRAAAIGGIARVVGRQPGKQPAHR